MLATALEWRQKWIAFRCDIKWLFAYERKEYKPQAVPGHGEGGGGAVGRGKLEKNRNFCKKKTSVRDKRFDCTCFLSLPG